ncbi:MAG TPA: DUF4034 domain-containing protein [Rhodanobacteraceae bacterium]
MGAAEKLAAHKLLPAGANAAAPFARAWQVHQSIRAGDFARADRLAAKVVAASKVGPWHDAPFAAFAQFVASPTDPELEPQLDAWVKAQPRNVMPLLLRGHYYFRHAWWVRGEDYAGNVSALHLAEFDRQIALAKADFHAVLRLQPDNANASLMLVWMSRQISDLTRRKRVFDAAIARHPDYLPLYRKYLLGLRPQWGGSIDEMKQFVAQYAGHSKADSPRRILYLDLYADLLQMASDRCGDDSDANAQRCVDNLATSLIGPELERKAERALMLGKVGDLAASHEIGVAMWWISQVHGAQHETSRFMLRLADIRKADVTLQPAPGARTDWVLDVLAGDVWLGRGNNANALTLYRRALVDLDHLPVPAGFALDSVKARINHDIENVYYTRHDYAKAVHYGTLAAKLAGGYGAVPVFGRETCGSLDAMNHYVQAIKVCSAVYDASGDWEALFYRGQTLEDAKQYALALADYRLVANGEGVMYNRTGSVINMTVIYGDLHQYRKQLAVADAYRYLFIPGQASDSDVAIYYNNRCYAYMKLHQLRKALDDCNLSLRHGNLPDAVAKKHQLERALHEADGRQA